MALLYVVLLLSVHPARSTSSRMNDKLTEKIASDLHHHVSATHSSPHYPSRQTHTVGAVWPACPAIIIINITFGQQLVLRCVSQALPFWGNLEIKLNVSTLSLQFSCFSGGG